MSLAVALHQLKIYAKIPDTYAQNASIKINTIPTANMASLNFLYRFVGRGQ